MTHNLASAEDPMWFKRWATLDCVRIPDKERCASDVFQVGSTTTPINEYLPFSKHYGNGTPNFGMKFAMMVCQFMG